MSMSNFGAANTSQFNEHAIEHVLGQAVGNLISIISRQAQVRGISLFLVGGVVRDVLLGRRNLDLDFVIEGDAISFAEMIVAHYGGSLQIHNPFATAKWYLDGDAAAKLALPSDEIPDHIDFARARSEKYAYPSALPTVSPGDIAQDLWRRDFSINTLAIQLSPKQDSGRLLDTCGGLADLQAGRIRTLHDDSFIDDPTRILRALRFAVRLDFEVEAHTAELMRAALPMLSRVTGTRLRNELDLGLQEAKPGAVFRQLQEYDALRHIHPRFRLSEQLPDLLARCCTEDIPWANSKGDLRSLQWTMLLAGVGLDEARSIAERLSLTQGLSQAIVASAKLRERSAALGNPALRPSEVTQLLEDLPIVAIEAGWLQYEDQSLARKRLAAYMENWRQQVPTITGADLVEMGLAAGPRYKQILDQLRYAWIDGELDSAAKEYALLKRLLAEED